MPLRQHQVFSGTLSWAWHTGDGETGAPRTSTCPRPTVGNLVLNTAHQTSAINRYQSRPVSTGTASTPPTPHPTPAPDLGLACACTKRSKESAVACQLPRRWASGEGCRERNSVGGKRHVPTEGVGGVPSRHCSQTTGTPHPAGRGDRPEVSSRLQARRGVADGDRGTGPSTRLGQGPHLVPRPTDQPGARCQEGSEHQKDRAASPASDAREAGRCYTQLL